MPRERREPQLKARVTSEANPLHGCQIAHCRVSTFLGKIFFFFGNFVVSSQRNFREKTRDLPGIRFFGRSQTAGRARASCCAITAFQVGTTGDVGRSTTR